ncbi:MAG: prepilin peptidase [candidate division Zixibacteria bacterium]|nr:prepilin peptidase [candidate division Zixibacteria bacterium]
MYNYLPSLYFFGVGAIVGSFLNVLIVRLPRGENFVSRRSHCPHCGALIRWYDNIPLLSFAILGGRCRCCRGNISWRYPLVELLTGAAFLLTYQLYGVSYRMILADLFLALLLVISIIDFREYIIPDKITIPGIILGFAAAFVNPSITPMESFIGFLAGGVSLYLVALLGDYIFRKESLGGGDIKLAAMLGAWLGWQNMIIIFFGGALLGLVYAIFQMARSRQMRRTRLIPFGPFLSLAALIALFWGDYLIDFYLQHVLQQ